MRKYDVAIIGGGIIGAAVAFEFAERKLRVVLLDRQQPGQEASWAAAGMLAPGPEYSDGLELIPFAQASFKLYPEFVRRIEERSGLRTGFRAETAIHVFFGDDSEQERDATVALYGRVEQPVEVISPAEARKREPALSPEISAAILSLKEGFVDNRALTDAALTAAQKAGAEVRADTEATGLRIKMGRCTGIQTGAGSVASDTVVLAAGSYSGKLEGVAAYAPTKPIRGQMVALRSETLSIRGVVRSASGYLVPRDDGRLIAGSTMEDAGYEKRLTARGIQKILNAAVELAPGLADAAIVETWCGLRPDTPDHLPILGKSDIAGLVIATGHFRNGILLAPMTARLMGEIICGEKLSLDLRAFSPLRFSQRRGATSAAHQ